MAIEFVDRRNTGCLKWDGMRWPFGESELTPLWIADMDFQVPDCVSQALHRRADHGVFGYSLTPQGFYEAFFQKRCRIGVSYGRGFGPGGEGRVRVNLATDQDLIRRAAQAIASQQLS